jgi:UDP-sulfoquinovose synthase
MRVFIAGIDGYLGFPLALYLTARGHEVAGADAGLRRAWVAEIGSDSAIPIVSMEMRAQAFREMFNRELLYREGNFLDYEFVRTFFTDFQPEAVVHLGQMPSAPYSMIDQAHCTFTQQNNVIGNLNLLWAIKEVCPDAHLVKLGTMGEYGTPNLDIPEGFFEVEYRGRKDTLPFPRMAGSFYHWSKVHDSNNTMFACKMYGLRATDIMQGVVFGTRVSENNDLRLQTRLDFDAYFGTALNRFCCQAVIGHPLTVYGSGGQTRGFLPLRDSMQCLTLAILNPPQSGEYRVFNQFEECYSIAQLADCVASVADELGLNPQIRAYENPRIEKQEHYYKPDRQHLLDLGYQPTRDIHAEVRLMLQDLLPHRERIAQYQHILLPDVRWDGSHRRSTELEPAPI